MIIKKIIPKSCVHPCKHQKEFYEVESKVYSFSCYFSFTNIPNSYVITLNHAIK